MKTEGNSCGECTACCHALAIPSIEKPAYVWCTHCNVGAGCRIYAERPKACVSYKCGWLQAGSDYPNMRPDHCGFIFEYQTINLSAGYVGEVLILMETREGALHEEFAGAVIDDALNEGLIVILTGASIKSAVRLPKQVTLTKGAVVFAESQSLLVIGPKKNE